MNWMWLGISSQHQNEMPMKFFIHQVIGKYLAHIKEINRKTQKWLMILEIYFIKYLLLLDTQPWKNLLDDYAMGLSYKCWYTHFYLYKINTIIHRVFSLNFWWGGGLKIFGPQRGQSRMGGGDLRKKSDWSQNCPLNAKLGHFLLF